PLAGMVPAYASSAALLYVACVMARGLAGVDWGGITETAPRGVAGVGMPLTYSIAAGIGLGVFTYCAGPARRRSLRRRQARGAGARTYLRGDVRAGLERGPTNARRPIQSEG